MKGRFQLPAYAKFNRPDPMRDWNWLAPHTINLYEYVGNDPINAWDPDGHSGEGPVRDTLTILKSAWDSFWHSAGEAVAAPLIAATYTFFAINEDLNQLSEYESTLGQSGSLSFSNTRSLAGGVISSASDSAKNGIHFAADTFTQLVINPDALVGTVSEHYGDVSPEEFGNKLGSFSFGMASAFAPASKGLSFGTSVSQSSNFEMFYRTMSEADFENKKKTEIQSE